MNEKLWPIASAEMIDTRAPLHFVEMTLSVRGVLAGPDADPYQVAGSCKFASGALAVGLQAAGSMAFRLPVQVDELDHEVVLADGWILDPTAEQFAQAQGPVVGYLSDFPRCDYPLVPFLDWRYAPTEADLIQMLAARWIGPEEITALLDAIGLPELRDAVRELDAILAAERMEGVS